MRVFKEMAAVVAFIAALMAITLGAVAVGSRDTAQVIDHTRKNTIYIRNLAPKYFSDAEIKNDIPAWESAINKDFAPIWHTPEYRFVFLGRRQAPKDSMVATFVKSGPVKGALAYHSVDAGEPGITVYSGTGAYYGYDNSVSFTHEIEELAADPTISVTNQGWPYDWVTVAGRPNAMPASIWAQEVSDPVESYSYTRPGANGKPVRISDFITPNWFNDEVNGGYDFMHLVQQPFTILPGGYAQYFDGFSWNVIDDFRTVAQQGFLKGESLERG